MTNNIMSSIDNMYALIRVLTKQRNGLKICHLYAQSMFIKIDEFRFILENANVDIICISESWLTNRTENFVDLNGYRMINCNRVRDEKNGNDKG